MLQETEMLTNYGMVVEDERPLLTPPSPDFPRRFGSIHLD